MNPYDVDESAAAIRRAIEMLAEQRRSRMARMRQVGREHTICWQPGELPGALARLPVGSLRAAR